MKCTVNGLSTTMGDAQVICPAGPLHCVQSRAGTGLTYAWGVAFTVNRNLRPSGDTVQTEGDMDIAGTFIQPITDLVTRVMRTVLNKGATGVMRILKLQGPISLAHGTLLGLMECWKLADRNRVLHIRMVRTVGGGPLG